MSDIIVFLDRATLRSDVPLRRPSFPHRWVEHPRTAPGEVAARIRDASIAITNKAPIGRAELQAAPGLQLIAVAATGTNVVDLEAAAERGVRVMNVAGYAADSAAEHAFALILALRRGLIAHRAAVLDGGWSRAGQYCLHVQPIADLAGSVLGVVGSGAIGARTAEIGRAFRMRVLQAERPGAPAVRPGRTAFEQVLETSDVLTLHCPSTPETRGMIGREALARRKPGAILINTARGDLVDESALREALQSGRLAGAGLDVAAVEPPPPGALILQLAARPDVIVTPHVAWAGAQAVRMLNDRLIDNVEAFVREREAEAR
jgi:glycerate dehydrogenase